MSFLEILLLFVFGTILLLTPLRSIVIAFFQAIGALLQIVTGCFGLIVAGGALAIMGGLIMAILSVFF